MKMLSRAGQKEAGQCIRASIPYVRADIPILIIFRALGFVVSRTTSCLLSECLPALPIHKCLSGHVRSLRIGR